MTTHSKKKQDTSLSSPKNETSHSSPQTVTLVNSKRNMDNSETQIQAKKTKLSTSPQVIAHTLPPPKPQPQVISSEFPLGNPQHWTCEQVFEFVKCVAGVNVAQVFMNEEVDGSALSLIRDDHLVNTMQIKLGPALKIMSKFNELTQKFHTQSKTTNVSQQQQQQQPMLMLPITQIHA